MRNTFDTYESFFNKYTASYGVICVTLIKITFKICKCDKHHLLAFCVVLIFFPSKDLIFFVCVACVSIKQIDSAI